MEKPNTDASSADISSSAGAPNVADAAQHVVGAHQQLKTLRDRLGILNRHPELEEALTKLGGMW